MEMGFLVFRVFGTNVIFPKIFNLFMCDLRDMLEEDCKEEDGILLDCFCLIPTFPKS